MKGGGALRTCTELGGSGGMLPQESLYTYFSSGDIALVLCAM